MRRWNQSLNLRFAAYVNRHLRHPPPPPKKTKKNNKMSCKECSMR